MARRKIKQITVDKVHALRKDGLTASAISKKVKLPLNTVNYILYQKEPTPKNLDELYAEADKAVKEADSTMKRIKRLLFGS
jgi:orotate phosphoribosyltransferase-like protein